MAIFTKSEFEAIAQEKARIQGRYISESRTYSRNTSTTSIFLSHAHTDREIVKQAKSFFENLGISIYVDWADETMPERTNAITAQRIKHQIASVNDKFILLATNLAVASKWCNWEVGIADTYKFTSNKIAILPLAENSGTWVGNEYLQIYPSIEPAYTNSREYFIKYPDGRRESIAGWLRR